MKENVKNSLEKMDLDAVIDAYMDKNFGEPWDGARPVGSFELITMAEYFFGLGLYSQLTWKDIRLISEIGEEFMNSEESDSCTDDETYYSAILNKLKQLRRDYKTERQKIRELNKALKGE